MEYTCPMHPEVRQATRGKCPKCGMALEPVTPTPPAAHTEYVCPMHPQIVRDAPGNCPICGMTLEPRAISAEKQDDPELRDMARRFWASLGLTLPVLVSAMSGGLLLRFAPTRFWTWFELILATPAVLWGGWSFFVRAWRSLVNRS
jgi:P-type Cu+ transporter